MIKIIPGALLMMWVYNVSAQQLYAEEYRPQFHFTPQSGWIGDPDGLIKYEDTYHLFWWGHAESSDLVYWNQKVSPMRGDDGSFYYYTGTVVVDKNNTSGFGDGVKPPMVAVYTAHNKSSAIQDQRLSYSNDYAIFQYYEGNPVLDIGSKEFRDPDVFWDTQTNRWIMCITLPVERKINFYASNDLKSWEYLSAFGPVGAREQVWEVPQLIQLPVDGDPNNRKWVMICSMGPNKMQYFTGAFNGTSFVLDPVDEAYLKNGVGVPGEVFETFESGYGEWSIEGNAFGSAPAAGTLPDQTMVSGYFGDHLVNSYRNGDASTGKLTSPAFVIERNNINFLMGGGNHPAQTCINLIINGAVVRTATGSNSEALKWKGWDVREFTGRDARLEIIDAHTEGWGHINVDHIMFSDVLMNTDREHARWIDWGGDFYAARAYRDYDDPQSAPVVWLGWMGNWEYANQVPTTWGRGAESIPREIELMSTSSGLQLVQKPIQALQKLRGDETTLSSLTIEQTYKLTEFTVLRNTYELEATFSITGTDQHVGLNLFTGSSGKLILGYDATTSNVYLDRRYAGNSSFSAQFPKISVAPLENPNGVIKFHVFADQSSIEVFVNDGAVVFTSLVFPYSGNTGIELFSSRGAATLQHLKAWPITSIWGIDPPNPVTGIEDVKKNNLHIYPNPARANSTVRIDFPPLEVKGKQVVVQVLDGRGSVLHTEDLSDQQHPLSITPQLTSGLYIVDVRTPERTYRQKLVIR